MLVALQSGNGHCDRGLFEREVHFVIPKDLLEDTLSVVPSDFGQRFAKGQDKSQCLQSTTFSDRPWKGNLQKWLQRLSSCGSSAMVPTRRCMGTQPHG